ncbi:MAG: hypothetical protein V1736_01200 [Pseudomonadota bacterium]
MDDPYVEKIIEAWNTVSHAYTVYEHKKPIIEYELPHGIVYAYPAKEYIDSLSARTRDQARQQYEEVSEARKFMVFISDTDKKVLRSYVFDVPNDSELGDPT